jgi:hypothetical protein
MPISLTDSTLGTLATDIVNQLETLTLEGINSDNIVYQQPPILGKLPLPCIVVSDLEEERLQSLNTQDDTIYVFTIATVQGLTGFGSAEQAARLKWREVISEAFHNKRTWATTTGAKLLITEVQPGATLDRAARDAGYEASYLLLRCRVRENRT